MDLSSRLDGFSISPYPHFNRSGSLIIRNFFSISFQESRTNFPEVRFYSNPIHSLYINIKNVVCNIGDDADVFVTLYEPPGLNEKEGRFIRYFAAIVGI